MGLNTDKDALTRYLTNAGPGGGYALTAAAHALEPLHSGAVAVADFNRDGSPDVFQTGQAGGRTVCGAVCFGPAPGLDQPGHLRLRGGIGLGDAGRGGDPELGRCHRRPDAPPFPDL